MSTKVIITLFFVLFQLTGNQLYATRAKAVSLDFEEKIKAIKEDSVKIQFLLKYADKYQLTDQSLSLEYALRAFNIAESADLDKECLFTLAVITGIFYQNELFDKAYQYQKKLIEKSEKLSMVNPQSYLTLSSILFSIGKPNEAESWASKGIELYAKANDSLMLPQALLNTGLYLYKNDYFIKALEYFNKSLAYFEQSGNKVFMAMAYNYIGKVYYEQTNTSQALDNYFKSLYLYQEIKADNGESLLCNDLSKAYLSSGDYFKAIEYANYAIQDEKAAESDNILLESYNVLSIAYASLSNFKKAYHNEVLYEQILREKSIKDNNLKLTQSQKQTELLNVILSLQLRQEKMAELNTAHKKSDKTALLLIVSFLLITVTLLTLVTICNVRSRKLRNELRLNAAKMQETFEELDTMKTTRNKFFAIISHDLKNPFNALLGFSNLLYTEYDEFSDIEKKKFIKQIYEASDNITKLLNNLLQWAKSQSGIIKIHQEAINLSTIAESVLPLVKTHADSKNIKIKSNIKSESPVYVDANMISTVIRNLVTNAIKFTPEYGEIILDSKYNGKFVEVSVTDTGIGMEEANLQELFGTNGNSEIASLKMISSSKGNGLGLVLCKEFVSKNGGKIWAESKVGKGSSFRFTLPLSSN